VPGIIGTNAYIHMPVQAISLVPACFLMNRGVVTLWDLDHVDLKMTRHSAILKSRKSFAGVLYLPFCDLLLPFPPSTLSRSDPNFVCLGSLLFSAVLV